MFWQMLCPPGEFAPPAGALAAAIAADFGSLEALQTKLSAAAAGVQGSGWGWLGYNKDLGKLVVATTANQDPLEAATGLVPVFGIDVWEVGVECAMRARLCRGFHHVIIVLFAVHVLLRILLSRL